MNDTKKVNGVEVQINDEEQLELDEANRLHEEQADARLAEAVAAGLLMEFELTAAQIKKGYPEDEIKTWDAQLQEARKIAGVLPAGDTPLIDAIVSVTGEDKAELATKIIQKAAIYKAAIGAAIGERRK